MGGPCSVGAGIGGCRDRGCPAFTAPCIQTRGLPLGLAGALQKVRLARQCFKERQASMLELQLLASLEHRNVLGLHEAWWV